MQLYTYWSDFVATASDNSFSSAGDITHLEQEDHDEYSVLY